MQTNTFSLSGLEPLREWINTIIGPLGFGPCNWNTTWQDGRAFAALLEYLSPNLINTATLRSEEAEKNLLLVIEKAKLLGVVSIDLDDVRSTACDELAIVTFLLQLYTLATSRQRQLEADEVNPFHDSTVHKPYNPFDDEKREVEEFEGILSTEQVIAELFPHLSTSTGSVIRMDRSYSDAATLLDEILSLEGERPVSPSPRSSSSGFFSADRVMRTPTSPRGSIARSATDPTLSPRVSVVRAPSPLVRAPSPRGSLVSPQPQAAAPLSSSQTFMRAPSPTPSQRSISLRASQHRSISPSPMQKAAPSVDSTASLGAPTTTSTTSDRSVSPSRAQQVRRSSSDSTLVAQLLRDALGTPSGSQLPRLPPVDIAQSSILRKEGEGPSSRSEKTGVSFAAHVTVAPAPSDVVPPLPMLPLATSITPPVSPLSSSRLTMSRVLSATERAMFTPALSEHYQVVPPPPPRLEIEPASEYSEMPQRPVRPDGTDLSGQPLYSRIPPMEKQAALCQSVRLLPITEARKSFRGVLHKQDPKESFIQGWKRRYFYLRRGRLYYYKNERENAPVSFIPLRAAMAIRPSTTVKHAISILTPHKEFVLRASSHQQMTDWLRELNLAKDDAALSEARADHRFQKEGLLYLADGKDPIKRFDQRYFYIRGGFLCYLESPTATEVAKKLSLWGAKVSVSARRVDINSLKADLSVDGLFEIETAKSQLVILCASSSEEKIDWIRCIEQSRSVLEQLVAS